MRSEYQDLIDRLENWRRYFKFTQTIDAVSWYTPPDLGDVWQPSTVSVSPDMRDAIHCELTWQKLLSQPKKYFIKHKYIERLPDSITWRRLKKLGVKPVGNAGFEAFEATALDYFKRNLDGQP